MDGEVAMTFDEAVTRVLAHEGGYVNDPADPGGETKYGISKRAYPREDIARLTEARAKDIYKRDYWDKLRLDALPENVRYPLFDLAVNSGVATAAKLLQRAVTVRDDGMIGTETLAAANRLSASTLAGRLAATRLLYLADLRPFDRFGRGWTRRVAQILLESV